MSIMTPPQTSSHPTIPTHESDMACSLPLTGSDPLSGESVYASACNNQDQTYYEPTLGEGYLAEGFKRGLLMLLEEIPYVPHNILIVGGCRQRLLARYLAFYFTKAHITILDPDSQQVEAAQEHFHCRFRFEHRTMAALKQEKNIRYDLTFCLNLPEFLPESTTTNPRDVEQAIAGLAHVSTGRMIISLPRQDWLWHLVGKRLPGMSTYLAEAGTALGAPCPDKLSVLKPLYRYGRAKSQVFPYPWWMFTVQMIPNHEECTTL